jgi:hypothetical protein
MKDLFSKAILDYQTNNSLRFNYRNNYIRRRRNECCLFVSLHKNADYGTKALELAKGKFGVGCGAGSHSLYLQNN